MSSPTATIGNNIRRGFELACRLLAGEAFDVGALQAELGVSRATAYRYHRFLQERATAAMSPADTTNLSVSVTEARPT